uniref:Reverse transcriptase Ty1/copia-type domain-containing protein n=1 Tax=Tanacetum cinerariifolium TaxID=118510 RepID=A0A699H605_TANCI|nr:hypothetical protein [Tanacetum cinerariifolium]
MITLSVGHKNDFVSDLLIDFQIKLSLSIGEIVTHWFTLIMLSALRRSGNIKREWRYEHRNPVSLKAQDGGDHMTMNRDYAWLMISRQSISSLTRVKDQVWMNKTDIETMSIDDLYNNFKIVKQDVKKSVGTSTGAQNMAFMTAPSTNSTNDVNIANPAYEASTVSPNVNTTSPQVSNANFSDNVVYAFIVENPNGSNLLQQDLEQIHKDNLKAMNLRWQLSLLSMRAKRECRAQRNQDGWFENQDNTKKQGNNEDTSSKAMLAIDGVGCNLSNMAEEQVQTNMALMAFLDSEVNNNKSCTKTCLKNYETLKKQCDDLIVKLNQTEFIAATYKRGLASVEEQLVTYKKNEVLFSEEVAVLKREVACKDYEINMLKRSQITENIKKGLGYHAVPPPYLLIYNGPTKLDLSYSSLDEFKELEFIGYGPKDNFKKFDGGYVTFGGGAHGGRISGKGTLKTGSLDFENNGVAERRNRTLIEAARTMLADFKLPITFWAEVVSTTCYVQNRVLIVKPHNKTPYELFRGFKPTLSFMRPFGYHVTILNTLDKLGKFDGKSDEVVTGTILDESAGTQGDLYTGTSLGKEATSQDYIVMPIWKDASYFDLPSKDVEDGTHNDGDDNDKSEDDSSPKEVNVAGQHIEPTSIAKALSDSSWVEAIQEELLQFKLQQVWILVDLPYGKNAIGTKWVFRNKKDERAIVIRNKEILVAQGHRQEEEIDYEEVFVPVARIEAIRLFLAYASFMDFMVYQMDVKSAFLYETIEEEVYVTQLSGFKDPDHPDKVYKVVKALYGLHQAPRACQDKYVHKILRKFNYLDVKSASTPVDLEKPLVKDRDANDVDVHLNRSMIGSLMYLTASRPDIMFCSLWYPRDSPFELVAYTDSHYDRATQDRKSTTGGRLVVSRMDRRTCYIKQKCVKSQSPRKLKRGQDIKIRQSGGPLKKDSLLFSQFNQNTLRTLSYLDYLYQIHILSFTIITQNSNQTSLNQMFWETASSSTFENREIVITATINGRVKSVTEASIRRHLKLEDSEGISSLPNTKIFEQLALMGVPTPLYDSPLLGGNTHGSEEGGMTLNELTLIMKVKKLENKVKSHKARRRVRLIVSEDEDDLEDLSKQGRKIAQIDKDEGITLVQIGISTANIPVTTTDAKISTASPEDKTAETSDDSDDITSVETLIEIKRSATKPQKLKGVAFRDVKETPRLVRSTITLQPLPSIDSKDNGKGVLVEEEQSSKKRQREVSDEESFKKQKLEEDNDAEKEKLRAILDIVPRDDIAINMESLATKYPIDDWKTYILTENMMYYQIIKADGSFKNYKIFSEMLDNFDRQDVIDLHRLVQERIAIHMLIEKTYSLTQEMLSRMLKRRIEVDHESEMAFELLRFTRSQLRSKRVFGSILSVHKKLIQET